MQDRSPESQKSLVDKLGLVGATFYHFESANLGVESVDAIKKTFDEFNPTEIKTLVVDLENVTFMNERGVVVLLGLRNKFRKAGSEVVLIDLGEQPKDKLELVGVLDDFRHFDSKVQN